MYKNQRTLLTEIQEQTENNNNKQFGLKLCRYWGISVKPKEA